MLAGPIVCQHPHGEMMSMAEGDMTVGHMAGIFPNIPVRLGMLCAFSLYAALVWAGALGTAQAEGFALPASGVKTPYSPLAIPTRLERLNQSLEQLLDERYHIVAAHPANGEEVLFLARPIREKAPEQGSTGQREADSMVICALTIPDPATDQNVPTSRCWALNHPH